jgi:glycosyltransferase involved in cell wall biosynthesis
VTTAEQLLNNGAARLSPVKIQDRPSSSLRVMHLIPYLGRDQGGPVLDLAACALGQAAAGCSVSISSVIRPGDGRQIEFDPRIDVNAVGGSRWGTFRRCPELWQRATTAECDLIHSHGLWTDVSRLAMTLARRRHLPHVLTPCGTLAPGALRHRWWKKVPVRLWFQDRALRQADCLQAQSHTEYRDIRRFGLRNPVAIVPAAVAGEPDRGVPSASDFRLQFNLPPERKIVLYLGRLHPVKGLGRLIEAWARSQSLKAESASLISSHCESRKQKAAAGDWLLVLAGPDEGGYRATLQALIEKAGCASSVAFTGPLDDTTKWAALKCASLFVMPSDFENFGLAIVEAMQCGLPVITTTGTPWEELRTAGAGWWVQPTVEDVAGALTEALRLSDDHLRGMGRRALELADIFRPEKVAEDLILVYRWLLGQEERPPCVVL